ncbi:MAG: nicotinate phosphoribosyltransferase [Blastopirellula sp.]|nr:MAG: nicotinate phosphoribosyltransferase [Blastopirellula sp.]
MNRYTSLALLTDLYELTMAYGYWKLGMADQEAVFHLFFRKPPFNGGYAIAAGLAPVVDFLEEFSFDDSDVEYLATLTGNDGEPLFESPFLNYLRNLELTCDIDAMPEGTLVFGQQPIIRVKGPLLQCQILETALLNIVNFQTLIATKASRISAATGGEPVLEFGLRRAQGIDGGLAASRAAYIGGCAATSNVLAGKLFGIPVRGTHAHSWVMSFDDEQEAFAQYAEVMPNNCVFLVDTYDTLEGVRQAITVGQQLRKKGHKMVGIRLDSGDLAHLSIEARKLLDEADFSDAVIVASNDLDEHIIESLKAQGAKIAVWGVGTKLVTGYDQPALGGVYKLGALKDADGNWQPKLKLSEQPIKTSLPGILQVRRFEDADGLIEDVIYNETLGLDENGLSVDLLDHSNQKKSTREIEGYDLLQPVLRNGKVVAEPDSIETVRNRAQDELKKLRPRYRRLMNPHIYRVGIDLKLHQLREQLITKARQPNN